MKLTVEERIRKAVELARFADEVRRAGKAARAGRKAVEEKTPDRSGIR